MPIQPSMAQGVVGSVEIFDEFTAGLKDLAGFDRVWLLFWFHRAAPAQMLVTPYLDSQERGLFATRAPARPNPIGLSNVRLLTVEDSVLRVTNLDILDGTPLLDVKPFVPSFDSFLANRTGWMNAAKFGSVTADDRFEASAGKRRQL